MEEFIISRKADWISEEKLMSGTPWPLPGLVIQLCKRANGSGSRLEQVHHSFLLSKVEPSDWAPKVEPRPWGPHLAFPPTFSTPARNNCCDPEQSYLRCLSFTPLTEPHGIKGSFIFIFLCSVRVARIKEILLYSSLFFLSWLKTQLDSFLTPHHFSSGCEDLLPIIS